MLYVPFCFISNFDFGFVISDPENPWVLTFSQIYNAFDFWPAFWDLAPLCDCEVRGVTRFLQVDEILGYLAEEASSRVELFCCTTMHVRILPGRYMPRCVSNSIRTYSNILHTIPTWHRRTFYYFQKWSTLLVNASQMMKTWRMLVE